MQNAADPPMILTVGDNTYAFGFQSELDDPPQALTGRCGDLRFPGPAGVAPACEIDAAVGRVRCK